MEVSHCWPLRSEEIQYKSIIHKYKSIKIAMFLTNNVISVEHETMCADILFILYKIIRNNLFQMQSFLIVNKSHIFHCGGYCILATLSDLSKMANAEVCQYCATTSLLTTLTERHFVVLPSPFLLYNRITFAPYLYSLPLLFFSV